MPSRSISPSPIGWARPTLIALALAAALVTPAAPARAATPDTAATVVVYGGTPAGVLAAVTASRAGSAVTLIEPSRHVGGLMTNGLTFTDVRDRATLGGYTMEFFRRIARIEGGTGARYNFASSSAERAFLDMIKSTTVRLVLGQRLPDLDGVVVENNRIVSLTTIDGTVYRARTYIDATYEGDLLARAGVPYRLGRESTTEYNESLAGVRPARAIMTVPKGVTTLNMGTAPGAVGSADNRVQDMSYRACFSTRSDRVKLPYPSNYKRSDYAMVNSYIIQRAANERTTPKLVWVLHAAPLSGQRFDMNAQGAMTIALPGRNYGWAEGTAAQRAAIVAEHMRWTRGLFYFLRYDSLVPSGIRNEMAKYGLCRDQFTDNANWPRQLYVREARRMVGAYVLTQRDISTTRTKTDGIGVASYRIDAHFASRWVDSSRRIWAEGWITMTAANYAIPYRSMTPAASSIRNLLVPVAASASHVAFASLRMEPHWLIMGEAAGQAAAMTSVSADLNVQDVNVTLLRSRLVSHGVVLGRVTNP